MDVWEFARGAERETVVVRGWLTAANAHRDVVLDLALAGHGVMRLLDWTNIHEIKSGALVRALVDWTASAAPPVNVYYHGEMRNVPRVQAFVKFVGEAIPHGCAGARSSPRGRDCPGVDAASGDKSSIAFAARTISGALPLAPRGSASTRRTLRGWSREPIIVLSARLGESDKIRALDADRADDYLTGTAGASAGEPTAVTR